MAVALCYQFFDDGTAVGFNGDSTEQAEWSISDKTLKLSMVALGVFVIAQGNDMAVFYRLRVNKNVGTLICMLLGLILIYTPVGSVLVLLRQGKSYLTVSPRGIEGIAISGKANAFVPNGLKVENVSLKFSEIQKCTASVENGQKKVIIYTTYGNHEFLGGDNYEQLAKTIQNALNR